LAPLTRRKRLIWIVLAGVLVFGTGVVVARNWNKATPVLTARVATQDIVAKVTANGKIQAGEQGRDVGPRPGPGREPGRAQGRQGQEASNFLATCSAKHFHGRHEKPYPLCRGRVSAGERGGRHRSEIAGASPRISTTSIIAQVATYSIEDPGDRRDPHLRLHHVTVFVRDQDRSLRFYVDQFGFGLLVDFRFEGAGRWIGLAPPDGTAILGLVAPDAGSALESLIGRPTQIVFVTDDVQTKYEEWHPQGVRFLHPPKHPLGAEPSPLSRIRTAIRSASRLATS
jgi:catechol 2,3-dioxygenase-like lactoylglutathione lyase family enzyme